MRCASLEKLADLVEDRLGAGEKSALELHLAKGCKRCRANWLWLQKVYELTASDSTPDPPDWLVKRAVASFANKPAAAKKAGLRKQDRPKGPSRIVALLVFDSFRQTQPADVRRLGEAGRQFVYRAEAYDIDLRFLPSENFRYENVIGQVLGQRGDFSDVSGLKVMVYKGKRKMASAETNPVGVFNLYNLPQGKYDLKVLLADGEIRIAGAMTSGLAY